MSELSDLIPENWSVALKPATNTPEFKTLEKFLDNEWKSETIYPPKPLIFEALNLTPLDQVKVVILGQDPYHGPKQAHGLAFSVLEEGLTQKGAKYPPSLRNILKELKSDLGIETSRQATNLESWAKQGVLMFNAVLTVRAGEADSHKGQGWEEVTDQIIKTVSAKKEPVIFVLWGNKAKVKAKLVADHHHIISSAHPSPLSASRGFFGSKPFSEINNILLTDNQAPIKWKLKSTHQPLQRELF